METAGHLVTILVFHSIVGGNRLLTSQPSCSPAYCCDATSTDLSSAIHRHTPKANEAFSAALKEALSIAAAAAQGRMDTSMGTNRVGESKDISAAPVKIGGTNAPSSSSNNSHQPPPPRRSPSTSSINKSGHRHSFAENLRNAPSSPRHRHPSLTQAAVQELLNHPPSGTRHANPRFSGREWRDIAVGELVSLDDVRWVEMDSSVEEATMVRPLS